jgi:uncharacterized protein (DUF58 family)
MQFKELEKIVARIQRRLFRNSNSYSIGMLKSNLRGSGLQFKEHQVYSHGDDVRFIDWKLSARTDHTYIKTFEEERDVEVTVIIDITNSMFMGYKNVSKLQACVEIACMLYLIVIQTNDKVKVVLWHDQITELPSRKGKEGIAMLISLLNKHGFYDEKKGFNYSKRITNDIGEKKKLSILKSYVARKKEVVFLSDFSAYENFIQLKKTMNYRNMHSFRVLSPLEMTKDMPYSILSKRFQDKNFKMIKQNSSSEREEFKGKWKELNLKDRYLDDFVKEFY